jgi:hypothetical protein
MGIEFLASQPFWRREVKRGGSEERGGRRRERRVEGGERNERDDRMSGVPG